MLDDCKLVTAQAGEHIALSDTGAHSFGNGLQHLVADGVAKRIVDFFETIEIEHEERKMSISVPSTCKSAVQVLAKQQAVGQIGQRIMPRHVRDLRL